MSSRPTIFISGVSSEFGSLRKAIQDVLLPKGIFPEEQTHFPPDFRSIATMLEEKIERSDAVIVEQWPHATEYPQAVLTRGG